MKKLWIFFLLVLSPDIGASTYFVSAEGSDIADGKGVDRAWRTVSKVSDSRFLPGDSILFRRGDHWREEIGIRSSGTEGRYIYLGAYGEGILPEICGADVIRKWKELYPNIWLAPERSYWQSNSTVVVVDGARCQQVASLAELNKDLEYLIIDTDKRKGGSPLPGGGYDSLFIYSVTDPVSMEVEATARYFGLHLERAAYIKVENLKFSFAGYAGLKGDGPGGHCIVNDCVFYHNREHGLALYNDFSHNLVTNCYSSYNGNGFYSYRSHHNIYRECEAHHSIHHTINSTVTGFGRSDGHGFGIGASDMNIVEHCEGSFNYQNVAISPYSEANSTIVRYNHLHDAQNGTCGISCGGLSEGARVEIYYNLLVNNGVESGMAFGLDGKINGSLHIFNNTMVNEKTRYGGLVYFLHGDHCFFQNNLLFASGAGQYFIHIIRGGKLISDHNLFYYPAGTGLIRDGDRIYKWLKHWMEIKGQDANSVGGNPGFIRKLPHPFTLLKTSPAINAGIPTEVYVDYFGNKIEGNPDIGAIEYSE